MVDGLLQFMNSVFLRQNFVAAFFSKVFADIHAIISQMYTFCLYQKLLAVSTELNVLVGCSLLKSMWSVYVVALLFGRDEFGMVDFCGRCFYAASL
jgi:hypothetical protein